MPLQRKTLVHIPEFKDFIDYRNYSLANKQKVLDHQRRLLFKIEELGQTKQYEVMYYYLM